MAMTVLDRARSTAPDPLLANIRQSDATIRLDDGRSMDVCFRFPPNIAEIARVFPMAKTGRNIVFTVGRLLYNPDRADISKWLLAHELEHTAQQGASPDRWWQSYLTDTVFRFDNELAAHQAEYKMLRQLEKNPKKRSDQVRFIAQRLSGPLYNNMVSFTEALQMIRK